MCLKVSDNYVRNSESRSYVINQKRLFISNGPGVSVRRFVSNNCPVLVNLELFKNVYSLK